MVSKRSGNETAGKSVKPRNKRLLYSLMGLFIGLILIALGYGWTFYIQNGAISDIAALHRAHPALFVIDILPILSVLFGYAYGAFHEKLDYFNASNTELRSAVKRNEKTERLLEKRSRQLKITQEEREQQARLLDQVITALPDRVYMTDYERKYLYVSQSEASEWGLQPEEMIGHTWWELGLLPDIMKILDQHRETVYQTGTSHRNEISFYNGSDLSHYEYILSPIFALNGMVQAVVTTVRDISQHKQAAQELEQSEARLFKFMESMPVGIFVVDGGGLPYYANKVALQILGPEFQNTAPGDAVSLPYKPIMRGTDQKYPAEALPLMRALHTGETVRVDNIEIKRNGGPPIPLEVQANPIFDDQKKIEFAVATFQDISERRKSESLALVKAKEEERDKIMMTVTDGLFILNRNLVLGSQYSDAVELIFESSSIAGLNFLEFLAKRVPQKQLINVHDYVELMFNPRIKEALIKDVNPLNEVEMNFDLGQGEYKIKHLEFLFKRIIENGEISGVLVTVRDISRQVNLARELEASKENNRRQMELMLGIIHIQPTMVHEFIRSAEREFHEINAALKKRYEGADRYGEKLNDIFRAIHTVKGNASLIGFKFFEEKSHEFENRVTTLQESPMLGGEDFLPLVTFLDQMFQALDQIREVVQLMGGFGTTFRARRTEEWQVILRYLEKLISDMGQKLNRRARLITERFQPNSIPTRYQTAVKEVLVQLVRNSLVHGVESAHERRKHGKQLDARLEITSRFIEDKLYVTYKDDGRGIPFEKLVKKAILSGKWDKETLRSWSSHQLANLIFEPGFSTLDKADLHGGRGVGMDIVRKRVVDLDGNISVDSVPGKCTQFTLVLPVRAKR